MFNEFGVIMLSFGIMVLIASQLIEKFSKWKIYNKCKDKSISIFCYDQIPDHYKTYQLTRHSRYLLVGTR